MRVHQDRVTAKARNFEEASLPTRTFSFLFPLFLFLFYFYLYFHFLTKPRTKALGLSFIEGSQSHRLQEYKEARSTQ